VVVAAVLVLLFCGTSSGVAAHYPLREEPILTLDELQHLLETSEGTDFRAAVTRATRLGPGYTWLLGDLLVSEAPSDLVDRICKALARNGDAESLGILRAVAADTSQTLHIRERAISALADARDHISVPLLQALSAESGSRVLAAGASEAVERIESPGRFRPLIEIENDILFFNFLLDDLESIEYSEPPDVSHGFAAAEFRRVCDLLQGGTRFDGQSPLMTAMLTFRLKDGTERAVATNGEVYGGVSGRSVRAPLLREFIWERLGREQAADEPSD
jgi:hypothetical protein